MTKVKIKKSFLAVLGTTQIILAALGYVVLIALIIMDNKNSLWHAIGFSIIWTAIHALFIYSKGDGSTKIVG